MADLPHPWNIYARHQAKLLRGRQTSGENWGTEAALDRILLTVEESIPVTEDDLARTAASDRRRDRKRTLLRLVYLRADEVGADPSNSLAARDTLRVACSLVSNRDWRMLCQLAEGHSYAEVAGQMGSTPGGLRVRVLRCRKRLTAIAA